MLLKNIFAKNYEIVEKNKVVRWNPLLKINNIPHYSSKHKTNGAQISYHLYTKIANLKFKLSKSQEYLPYLSPPNNYSLYLLKI